MADTTNFQIRIGRDHIPGRFIANTLAEAAQLAADEPEYEVTVWERGEGRYDWALITVHNPKGLRPEIRWFAGRTISPNFHLSAAARRAFKDAGIEAPANNGNFRSRRPGGGGAGGAHTANDGIKGKREDKRATPVNRRTAIRSRKLG